MMQPTPDTASPSEADKVIFLSRREIWPHEPRSLDVLQTHMSWVFIAGSRVYKLKKPVRTDFLDFSTLAARKAAVADEIRLNRRLAPEVYLGARALRISPRGGLTLATDGRIVDWLVEMRRLPEDRTLEALIRTDGVRPQDLGPLSDALANFYRGLGPADITPARFSSRFLSEHRISAEVLTDERLAFDCDELDRQLALFEEEFAAVRPLLEQRVVLGRVVEGHGDLRPEHVFLTDPPVIIDCLEFNRELRTVDPFEEIVFLGLECAILGCNWVFHILRSRLETDLADRPDPRLLAFYWRYRALLRARLALLHLRESVLRKPGKWRPLARHYVECAKQAEFLTARE